MVEWGTDDEFFDDVEREHLDFIQTSLPNYLAFHKAYCGFLPENFNGGTLGAAGTRASELRRLGFLNYSVLVNALLVQRAADTATQPTGMLDVYGRTSAFFLRAGAAIDIAEPLEASQRRVYDGHQMSDGPGGTPNAAALAKRLSTVNNYNNYLKHNGLPAVRLVEEDDGRRVEIPEQIPMRAAVWNAQKPNAPLGTCYRALFMSQLSPFSLTLVEGSLPAPA